jgi:tRNA-binding EMAP/Myf-like protein
MFRLSTLVLVALALVCFAAAPALAEEKAGSYEGTFVKAEDNKIYMKGLDGKDQVHDLEAKPTVTSDGVTCKIADLKPGVKIKVTVGENKKVNKIEATDTLEGTFVKAEDNKIYFKGTDGKDWVLDLEAKPTVTSNGAASKLEDLKPGNKIKVTVGINKKVNKIEAATK